MAIESFYETFPELTENELRNIILFENKKSQPPEGSYAFLEFFCTKRNCDCRMVTIKVYDEFGKEFTTLKYGWEKTAYYIKWGVDYDLAKVMASVSLCPLSHQSQYAEYFSDKLKEMLDFDENYKKRIERHYDMLREAKNINNKSSIKKINYFEDVKVGRNSLCPCGSNKKFKKCCMPI